jgi:hypothetical protein
MRAEISADRSAFRRRLPITHACSHVKWANVNDLSSRASSVMLRVGFGSVSSIVDGSSDVCVLWDGGVLVFSCWLLWIRETGYKFIEWILGEIEKD